MSTYLHHLDRASGFLAHTLLVYTWIWVTPVYSRRMRGPLNAMTPGPFPSFRLPSTCQDFWWVSCVCSALMILAGISAMLIYFQFSEDDTLLSTEPLSVSLEVPLHPIPTGSEHRGLQTVRCWMIGTAFLCHPGHGILSLSIICEAAVMVVDFDFPLYVREYLNLHQRKTNRTMLQNGLDF